MGWPEPQFEPDSLDPDAWRIWTRSVSGLSGLQWDLKLLGRLSENIENSIGWALILWGLISTSNCPDEHGDGLVWVDTNGPVLWTCNQPLVETWNSRAKFQSPVPESLKKEVASEVGTMVLKIVWDVAVKKDVIVKIRNTWWCVHFIPGLLTLSPAHSCTSWISSTPLDGSTFENSL